MASFETYIMLNLSTTKCWHRFVGSNRHKSYATSLLPYTYTRRIPYIYVTYGVGVCACTTLARGCVRVSVR